MNILLLNPPDRNKKKFIREGRCTQEQGVWATLWPPLSLAMIAAVLERDGHEVRVRDCPAEGVGWDELPGELRRFSPGLVVWSTGTPSIDSDLSLAGDIKAVDAAIYTAVFGTHVTVLDRQCLEAYPQLDCVMRNEPELTAAEIAAALHAGTTPDRVAGISFRNDAGNIVVNPDRPFIEDLDSLPLPAWHLIDLDNYILPMKGRRFVIVAPQRGCPFACSFCTCQTYYGKRLRKRSVDRVVAEIADDIKRFAVRDFFFWAETFVLDKQYVADLCRAILAEGLRISWTCNSRVDSVDEHLLGLMARAGCWMISYGIESADQRVLDEARKGITVRQIQDAVRLTRTAGIKTAGHLIFGLPGETEESMGKTIRLAKELGLDIAQFYCAVPFPGSRLYEQAVREGWITPSGLSGLRQDRAVMNLPTVSARTVNRFRARAFRTFYGQPAAWYRILKLMDFKSLPGVWQTLRDFVGWSH